MGKRGPKPMSPEDHRRRGRRTLAKRRERTKVADAVEKPARAPRTRKCGLPADPLPRSEAAWRALVCSLPRFDPHRLAGDAAFDAKRAAKAIRWIESHCRHIKGAQAGQLLRLVPFQRAIVANLFGWRRPDGARRFRKMLFYVPRKNAKTTLAAAITLYVFFEDKEPGAELYSAAAKEKQAKIVWKIAKGMISRDEYMRSRCRVYVASIVLDDGESFFQPIASEGKSEHGASTHLAVIDELHAQATPDLMEAISTSHGGRRQWLDLMLTTADSVGETVCNDEYEYAKSVRDNPGDASRPGFDPGYLPVIYEASVEDDWTSEEVWRRANPLYDTSPTIRETLRDEVRKARSQASYTNAFRRWYLNVQTETATSWLVSAEWDACGSPFDARVLAGHDCLAAIDLSSTTDMTALVLFFPAGNFVLPFFWVPEEAARERDRRNEPMYLRWAQAGHLNLTSGNVIDYDAILAKVDELAKAFRIREIAIDPWKSRQVSIELQKRGHRVVEIGQKPSLISEPARRLETLLKGGQLRHGGHPVLRWNALNAKVRPTRDDPDLFQIIKPSGSAKVDGIVCVVMALARHVVSTPPTQSIYEKRGPIVA